ncbi:MAG TPA: N-acetylmuramoyl-L-alanine amidase [Anaerolineaceae bacterium]|jgi:N-acetylmuramoyl-L-alanine amidase|nr:N-acetylmuramoyl-L-alanine amidase [Anaerolineaceae bacterium]
MMRKDPETQPTLEKSTSPSLFNTGRVLQTVILVAAVLATLFTLWNPYKLFSQKEVAQSAYQEDLANSSADSSTIGILVGHWKVDSGHVCDNGVVEANITEAISNQVSIKLNALGYPVKLLAETDLDLVNYRGLVLVALYTGSCDDSAENKSGFTIGTTLSTTDLNSSNALAVCMGEVYQASTKLDFSYQIISPDQPAYTYFERVNRNTPMIYLEMGSLLHDRSLLIENSDKVANGIVNGIQCYLDTLEKAE